MRSDAMVNTSIVLFAIFKIIMIIIMMMTTVIISANKLNDIISTGDSLTVNDKSLILKRLFPTGKISNDQLIKHSGRFKRSLRPEYAFPYYDDYLRRKQYPLGRMPETGKHKESHGIHVANWRWDEIGIFFTFTAFVVVTGLAKVGEFSFL